MSDGPAHQGEAGIMAPDRSQRRHPAPNGPCPPYRTHKRALYGQQEGNCGGCRTHFEARNLEVDHIISRHKGGTDHIENLQLLCGSCNRIKGDRGMEYLKARLQIMRKRPDYGDATPEDLVRALMTVHPKTGHYQPSERRREASSRPELGQPAPSDPGFRTLSDCASPQTPERTDQDASD